MRSLEVVLVMAGAPLAIIVLVGLLTLGPHVVRIRRSRPDPKSNRPPVLWTVNPEELRGGLNQPPDQRGGTKR